jgi:hypothetical protein
MLFNISQVIHTKGMSCWYSYWQLWKSHDWSDLVADTPPALLFFLFKSSGQERAGGNVSLEPNARRTFTKKRNNKEPNARRTFTKKRNNNSTETSLSFALFKQVHSLFFLHVTCCWLTTSPNEKAHGGSPEKSERLGPVWRFVIFKVQKQG